MPYPSSSESTPLWRATSSSTPRPTILFLVFSIPHFCAPADVTCIDLEAKWTVEPGRGRSKSHNTPFAGQEMMGRAALTIFGGKVVADWPGLSTGALYEGRDLKPTTDLDSLIAGALAQHYALEPSRVMTTLFPETRGTATGQPLIVA